MKRQTFLPPDLHHSRDDSHHLTSQALSLTEIDVAEAPAEDYRSSGSFFDGLILIFWGFSISFLIVLIVRRFIFYKVNSRESQFLNHSQTTPCARCRYFSKNPYIKCAVNPLSVQKIDANDCSDFSPPDDDD